MTDLWAWARSQRSRRPQHFYRVEPIQTGGVTDFWVRQLEPGRYLLSVSYVHGDGEMSLVDKEQLTSLLTEFLSQRR